MSPSIDNKRKDIGSLVHIVGFLFSFIGTGLMLLMTDDKFVKKNAIEATNWQISIFIYTYVLSFIGSLAFLTITPTIIISFLLILNTVFSINATVKSSKGEVWEYPLSLNLLKKDNTEDQIFFKDSEEVERVKNMYLNNIIDEDEMEKRIENQILDKTKSITENKNIEQNKQKQKQ